jgi:L-threonylcarbamoyladenylate synthase
LKTTRILDVRSGPFEAQTSEAAEVLRLGGLVAFPTETVYGLGADALDSAAVELVFKAKGRPSDNPLIVHIHDKRLLDEIARSLSVQARHFADKFWPGPLTLVVEHRGQFPDLVTAGLPTVAIRMPNHPVTLAVIRSLGRPIVGPSANLSGKPSPTTAQHVYDDLNGKIDLILDGGPTSIGVESTVVDVTGRAPAILRLGGLPRREIERFAGTLTTSTTPEQLKRSPGTRYRHYAPSARVELIRDGDQKHFLQRCESYLRRGESVGCIVHSLHAPGAGGVTLRSISVDDYAHRLFELMREFDDIGIDIIIVETIPGTGLGEAVMDRLRKASESG